MPSAILKYQQNERLRISFFFIQKHFLFPQIRRSKRHDKSQRPSASTETFPQVVGVHHARRFNPTASDGRRIHEDRSQIEIRTRINRRTKITSGECFGVTRRLQKLLHQINPKRYRFIVAKTFFFLFCNVIERYFSVFPFA